MYPPAFSPRRRAVFRHPLLGAAGYRLLQAPHIRWAHPRAIVIEEKSVDGWLISFLRKTEKKGHCEERFATRQSAFEKY
jgi:hypothetical protein